MIEYVVIFILIWVVLGAIYVAHAILVDYNEKINKRKHHVSR